jgi:hypothetical protein
MLRQPNCERHRRGLVEMDISKSLVITVTSHTLLSEMEDVRRYAGASFQIILGNSKENFCMRLIEVDARIVSTEEDSKATLPVGAILKDFFMDGRASENQLDVDGDGEVASAMAGLAAVVQYVAEETPPRKAWPAG